MASKAKVKGSGFERKICEHLYKAFGLPFTRVPSSGAIFTNAVINQKKKFSNTQLLVTEGDIIPPTELEYTKIECKCYQSFSFNGIYSQNKQLDGWISQAKQTDKLWFLIFNISNKGTYVVYDWWHSFNVPMRNYSLYNEYKIVFLDGFFESNRDNILKINENYRNIRINSTTTPVTSG